MKIVVAYSGGLDTSYTVMYLANQGHEVYAASADTGGFSPAQLKKNEENAYKLGAKGFVNLDVKDEYYEKSLKYMVFGNVLRGGTYPISVSSERIFQAIAIARYAKEIGADAIAHGSTGAGNDQVRFDMTFQVMCPDMEIITLTRDKALTRQEEVDYLNDHGFPADFAKLKYSYNVGLWGTSICGGELLDSAQGLPESAYLKPVTKSGNKTVKLGFEKGQLVSVDGKTFDSTPPSPPSRPWRLLSMVTASAATSMWATPSSASRAASASRPPRRCSSSPRISIWKNIHCPSGSSTGRTR